MSEGHTHTASEVGAADDFHLHTADEILGLTAQEGLDRALAKIEELTAAVSTLAGQLEAERELTRSVIEGSTPAGKLIAALRKTAQVLMASPSLGQPGSGHDARTRIAYAFLGLAREFELEMSEP